MYLKTEIFWKVTDINKDDTAHALGNIYIHLLTFDLVCFESFMQTN